MHSITDEGWNPYRLVILVQITLFFYAQNDMWGLGPKETCNSGPKVALLHAKTTDEGWE